MTKESTKVKVDRMIESRLRQLRKKLVWFVLAWAGSTIATVVFILYSWWILVVLFSGLFIFFGYQMEKVLASMERLHRLERPPEEREV